MFVIGGAPLIFQAYCVMMMS